MSGDYDSITKHKRQLAMLYMNQNTMPRNIGANELFYLQQARYVFTLVCCLSEALDKKLWVNFTEFCHFGKNN